MRRKTLFCCDFHRELAVQYCCTVCTLLYCTVQSGRLGGKVTVSLQVLTECKQNAQFASLVSRLEKKSQCKGRSLELFLTYPMHQIPRYIITLHELLAHTPPDHVEKNSLEQARVQLEDLSRQMHDEVSETENIRKNLAIERMIVEGCDILLDVNQVFVRQGTLLQVRLHLPGTTR